jgi:hypothetical protein
MTGGRQRWTLDPKIDLVFSLLFGAERNRGLLIALLNEVLRPSTRIVAVEVLPPQPEPTDVEEKPIFLDLRVRLEPGGTSQSSQHGVDFCQPKRTKSSRP